MFAQEVVGENGFTFAHELKHASTQCITEVSVIGSVVELFRVNDLQVLRTVKKSILCTLPWFLRHANNVILGTLRLSTYTC